MQVQQNGRSYIIDQISGPKSSGSWKSRNINLSAFMNNGLIEINFLATIADTMQRNYIALDDISIADSLTTGVETTTKTKASSYKIYPNPSKGQFTLLVA